MENKFIVGLVVLTLMLTAGVASVSATSNSDSGDSSEKFQAMEKNREEKKVALENNDYRAWESLMQEKTDAMQERAEKLKENINEETFAQFQEIHQLMEDGKYDEAKKLKEEMGFGKGVMGGKTGMMKHKGFMKGNCPCESGATE